MNANNLIINTMHYSIYFSKLDISPEGTPTSFIDS